MPAEQRKQELEDIDDELTSAMLNPEKMIHVPHHAWWSDTLKNALLTVQYWKTVISLLKQPQQDRSILLDIKDKLGFNTDIYQGNPNASPSTQLRKAKKY